MLTIVLIRSFKFQNNIGYLISIQFRTFTEICPQRGIAWYQVGSTSLPVSLSPRTGQQKDVLPDSLQRPE
jgi:hypothetical protein